jgi:hypothetical protein
MMMPTLRMAFLCVYTAKPDGPGWSLSESRSP